MAVIPLGVSGAAYATVAAQAVSGVLCLVYVWKKYEIVHFGKEERAISLRSILKLLAMGVPMALQFFYYSDWNDDCTVFVESARLYVHCILFCNK